MRIRESIKLAILVIAIALVASMNLGCASFGKKFKAFLNGRSVEEVDGAGIPRVSTPKFSETENMRYNVDRKYRKMNRDRFEDEAEVAADAGSLWVMEGQGAYLFAQNTTRLVGDLLKVRIDGSPKNQLQTKTRVIAKLLERLERPETNMRGLASQNAQANAQANSQANAQPPNNQQQAQNNGQPPQPGQPAAPGQPGAAGAAPGQNVAQAAQKPEASFSVQNVPTRIVEVLRDGSYRVKGSQEFMIGKREYRVIVTGIVRPEDFNEDGIEAEKLLDSQFDIVSAKRGATL